MAAIEKVTGNGLTFLDYTQLSEGPSGPANIRQRTSNAFQTAYETINELERVKNKRKAVIWVSQGYDFDPFPGARRGTDKVFGGRYGSPTRDLIRSEENPFFRSSKVKRPDVRIASRRYYSLRPTQPLPSSPQR